MNNVDQIHIGKIIKEQVALKGIRISWLAEQLHCHRNNIYKIYEKQWIDTHILMNLSKILDFDFFLYLSKYLNDTNEE